MSNLSEEEIIKNINEDLDKAKINNYMVADFNVYDIQGLLDLYNKEKEKNKEWQDKIKDKIKELTKEKDK